MKIEEIQARYPHRHLRSNAFIDNPHLKSSFQKAILLILLIISENTVGRGRVDIGNAYQTTTTLAGPLPLSHLSISGPSPAMLLGA
jgi:hypothetical protein